jgi:hypothetical protein
VGPRAGLDAVEQRKSLALPATTESFVKYTKRINAPWRRIFLQKSQPLIRSLYGTQKLNTVTGHYPESYQHRNTPFLVKYPSCSLKNYFTHWDLKVSSLIDICQHSGPTYCLHLHSRSLCHLEDGSSRLLPLFLFFDFPTNIEQFTLQGLYTGSRDSSVGVATTLRAERPRAGVRFQAEERDFSLFRNVQTVLGSTQPPIQWVPAASPLIGSNLNSYGITKNRQVK